MDVIEKLRLVWFHTYIVPDSRVLDLPGFYDTPGTGATGSLVRGWEDRAEAAH